MEKELRESTSRRNLQSEFPLRNFKAVNRHVLATPVMKPFSTGPFHRLGEGDLLYGQQSILHPYLLSHWGSNLRETVIAKEALHATECLPVLEETDRKPSLGELNEALNSLASGKVLGKDGSSEMLQRGHHDRASRTPLQDPTQDRMSTQAHQHYYIGYCSL